LSSYGFYVFFKKQMVAIGKITEKLPHDEEVLAIAS
jgi:hypothetical protein